MAAKKIMLKSFDEDFVVIALKKRE